MTELEALYVITKQLVEELERIDKSETNREVLIKQVNELIGERESIIQQIDQPFSEEELAVGKQIIQMNERVKRQMNALYNVIKDDLRQVQKKKKQNYSYIKPYGDLKTPDGMYLDNKL